ncbi:aspartate carbamoyltransferase catalytic subunit [Salsuginibacillus kocurii]|uniref:aspartate carbamoyltransferase catalytic subunit n=1 Tax=Salsuginibacillus kocurii TaxID=427078 RepID=UPI0003755A6D|nr:aspartate carbamoyltransferase catalytic subunit [Salsuginibacillus kocurii]
MLQLKNKSFLKNSSHITTLTDLPISIVHSLLSEAEKIKRGQFSKFSEDCFVANLFFEPSTRTKMSFEAAEKKLGMHILNVDADQSSVTKGETLYDTVKTMEAIGADVVVVRHRQDRYFDDLVNGVKIPIINGGDGCGHHPSQSLLDLMTIQEEFGSFQGLNVVIAGDIQHSRVARSNIEALQRLGANVYVSGPREWVEMIDPAVPYLPMDAAVKQADVMMMLRIQHERHAVKMAAGKDSYHQLYGLTLEREQRMKSGAIIMHPAPINRGVEIASELVECERSRIFKQMKNGVFIRMALLQYTLNEQLTTANV